MDIYCYKVAGAGAPYYVMGGCSVVGGLLALLLPETLGTNLPETVEDVEHIQVRGGQESMIRRVAWW